MKLNVKGFEGSKIVKIESNCVVSFPGWDLQRKLDVLSQHELQQQEDKVQDHVLSKGFGPGWCRRFLISFVSFHILTYHVIYHIFTVRKQNSTSAEEVARFQRGWHLEGLLVTKKLSPTFLWMPYGALWWLSVKGWLSTLCCWEAAVHALD